MDNANTHEFYALPLVGFPPALPHATAVVPELSEAKNLDSSEENLARLLAAVVALHASLDTAYTLDDAGQRIAKAIYEFLSAKRVVLLWRDHANRALSKIGDSAPSSDSPDALRALIAAGEEIVARGSLTRWPHGNTNQRHSLLCVAQLAEQFAVKELVAIRLSQASGSVDEKAHGALFVFEASASCSERFLRVVADPVHSALSRIADSQPSRFEFALRALSQFARGRSRDLLVLGLMLACIVLMLPMRYRVSAPLELQPQTRRFIAVPFDGPLQSVSVRPGDLVEVGGPLAKINPREIEFELAGSLAEWNRAEQERKTLMAKHDFSGSKLAELEAERLRLKTELLQHQRDHLEVCSPIAGMVVSGDHSQSEGRPMTRGEALFEIAPLGNLLVEIAIPELDIAEVRTGMTVNYFLHSFPSRKMQGEIQRIQPRAVLREQENVFMAEVALHDPDGLYRPGMQGRASIVCDRHTLAWNLFHHAYFSARQWIGW